MAEKAYKVGFVFGAKKAAGFDKTFKGISSSVQGIAKGIAGFAGAYVGVSAMKTAVVEVVKSFGELEQNLGGSEAVFGQYAKAIQKTGEDAYKNLGVTQSDYLGTANKMGALFQGSGIEQAKSLELTEKAMQRAADMASVMGIDMEMAMESVAGAAKGNFTMMDNLGIAMNATNIEAYALEKGINFKWNTASQAEKAETAMQMFFEKTEQYAGNFAREATQTVSGSFGLLQASWGSLVAGLGNEDADMSNLTGNVIDAFGAVATNVKPILKNVITKALPAAVVAAVPALEGPFNAIGKAGSGAIQFVQEKWDQHGADIIAFGTTVKDRVVGAFNWIRDTGQAAFDAIAPKVQDIIPKVQEFADNVITIGDKIDSSLRPAIDWVATVGFPAIMTAGGGVLSGVSAIAGFVGQHWGAFEPIIMGIVGAFIAYKAIMVATTIAQNAHNLVLVLTALKTGGLAAAQTALTGAQGGATVAQWALNAAMLANPVTLIIVGIAALIAIGVLLYKNWDTVKAKAIQLWDGIKTAFAGVGEWFGGIWEMVKGGFKSFVNFIISGINKIPEALNGVTGSIGGVIGIDIPKIPTIPLLAKGGVATAPTLAMVGEGKESEAILPLSKLKGLMGDMSVGPVMSLIRQIMSSGGGAPRIVFQPELNFYGSADKEEVKSAMTTAYEEFERFMDRYLSDRKRKGLAQN